MEYLYIHGVQINRINLRLPRFHKCFQHCIIIYTSIYTMQIPAAFIVAQILSSADAFSSYNFPTNRASALPTLPQSASLSSSSPIFFQQQTKSPRSQTTQIRYSNGNSDNSNYLLDEFRTADGEIVNPYRVLKVGRHADRKEIRQSYRSLSKKYHPDGARFREVLPGSWYVERWHLYSMWISHRPFNLFASI